MAMQQTVVKQSDCTLANFIQQMDVVEAKLYILNEKIGYGFITEEDAKSKLLSLNAEFEFLAEVIQEEQDKVHNVLCH